MTNQSHLNFLRGLDEAKSAELVEGILVHKSWPIIEEGGNDTDELDPLAVILFCAENVAKDEVSKLMARLIGATVGRMDGRLSIVRSILSAGCSGLAYRSDDFGQGFNEGQREQAEQIAKVLGMYTLITKRDSIEDQNGET